MWEILDWLPTIILVCFVIFGAILYRIRAR
jgi:hypothetical protein